MKLSNKVYDVLKFLALIVLPALAILYDKLAVTWGLPYGPQIKDTIIAVDVFLGAVLQISTTQYWKEKDGEAE